MQAPDFPQDEQRRLQALHDLKLLDTLPEERFDRLTRLARHMFDVSIALVSLVDAQRQWFKSRQGLDACETGRDISFCGHAILDESVFLVSDATQDPRFADNPLVTGDPGIRFYAGAPLRDVNGYRLGTLCIIDNKPRSLRESEIAALRDLADCVESEINRLVESHLHTMFAASEARNRVALKNSQDMAAIITRAQSQFINEQERGKAFDNLLGDFLALTDSEYGFIGEVLKNAEGAPYLKTYAITNIAWDDETRGFYADNAPQGMEFHNLKTLFGAALISGKTVIASDPYQDPRRGGLPDGHPALNAFLGIPIHHGDELVAMVGVANRPGGYDHALVDFLQSLLLTVGQLIIAMQVQQQHRAGQRELARLSQVASQTTNGVIITGADGRVEWINEGFTRITGYTLEEMHGHKPGERLKGPETNPETVNQIRAALARNEGFEVDLVNYTKAGAPYWIRIQCSPLRDEHNVLQGFIAIESDITRQKQAEEALQGSEERLRALFELSPIGISLNDYGTGTFLALNDALLQPTGYTREEFIALSYWDVTPVEYQPQEQQQIENMEKTGRYGPFEKEYIRKDGSRYPVLLNGMVVRDNSGRKLIWSMVEDISERKRGERMKNEFISTVSHELRTPLTAISGALGLVVGGATGALPEPVQEMLKIAHNNSQRLGILINDLLDMEKLLAGKMRFELRAQPLQPLLEQAIENNLAYADRFQVQLRLNQGADGAQVRVDGQRLQQVLANLLSNAAKFSPEGGEVVVSAASDKGFVRVSVRDRGPGIPDDFRERIFQKFSQADASDTRQKGGSGLGLAISRELMERMGGSIGFDSVRGEGATFWLTLPLAGHDQGTRHFVGDAK